MNRRKFFKKAGLGSIALASLLTLDFTTPASADDNQTNFRFVSVSAAVTIDGVAHRMIMNGNGKVTPSQVVGGGSFVHINNAPPVPKPILASGTWKAKRLLSFELIGTYGSLASGVLEMEIDLLPEGGPVTPATLEVICNIGAAGLSTGEEEGFILTIPGAPFGPFMPLVPAFGLLIFTTGNEKRD